MVKTKKIIIAGGGIGGLAAAANLLQAGFDVEVYEQASQFSEVGAGIQVSANGSRVLHALGLEEALKAVSVQPTAYVCRLHDSGDVLQQFSLADHEERFGAAYYHIHRGDIHSILVDKVRALKPDAISLNKTAQSCIETDDKVTLKFTDGTEASGDLLIGADGIKSVVRQQVVGPEEPNFTGQVAWRLLVPTERLPAGYMDKIAALWVGPGKHLIMYYLQSGDVINFVGLVKNPNWTEEGWTIKCSWDELKADFEGWHPDVQTFIDAADKDACYRWALNNRAAASHWSSKRITLLGDAAHPTLPYMAQGAVMAIEDGAVLTRALQSGLPLAEALDLYQRNRIPRTTRIVNESTEHGEMFQLESESQVREAFSQKDMGAERAEWLYSYNPLTVTLE